MAKALHTPLDTGEAKPVGKRLWRKQLLPVGSIDYEGRKLDFSKDYLDGLAKNFAGGAFDQVPFLLANEKNEHHFDPEKCRGEVKGMEASDDGLYALIELSEDGDKIVRDNPKLGISARIVEGLEKAGQKIGPAVQHALGTLDPKVTGMKPWEAVSLSAHADAEVTDLTAASFSKPVPATTSKPKPRDISEEEAQRIVAGVLDEINKEDEDKDEPKAAELSSEQKQAIELAERRAKEANDRVSEVEAELRTTNFEAKKAELIAAGVPPKLVNLAEPVLTASVGVIELSNGQKLNARDVVENILDECKGIIDFSVIGRGDGESSSQEADAKAAAKQWEKQEAGS